MTPRLTFPGYDVGATHIMAGGEYVGFCLAEFYLWRARLFKTATTSRIGPESGCEEVTGRTLGELRRRLRDRVAAEGPWWAS